MNRTRWNDDLETYLDTLYYRKDEVDEMISRLELNSGLVFSVEVEDEIFSVDDSVQEFRANLSYANGSGVEDKSVLFSLVDGNGNSVDTSLITTDVDGYAVYEYTPTGRGQVFVTASYGTLLQETYEVYDCSFIDNAVTDSKNTNWNKGSALSVSTDSTGTTLSASSSTINNGRYIETVDLTGDFIIEWKMKATYGIRCGLSNTTTNMTNSTYFMTNSEYSEYRDWKIECVNGVLTAYIYHNNQWEQLTWSSNGADPTNSLYFAFSISSNGTTYTGQYKDLRIYPI